MRIADQVVIYTSFSTLTLPGKTNQKFNQKTHLLS